MKSNSFLVGLLVCVTLLSVSCNDSKELRVQNRKLKDKNDSLMSILDTLKTKYIFDKAFVKVVPNHDSINKKGTKYNGRIFFLAYNEEDIFLLKTDKEAVPDTLHQRGGEYHFKTPLLTKKTYFYFNPLIRNKTALEFANLGYHGVNFISKYEKK